jgi:hypothetical protein
MSLIVLWGMTYKRKKKQNRGTAEARTAAEAQG